MIETCSYDVAKMSFSLDLFAFKWNLWSRIIEFLSQVPASFDAFLLLLLCIVDYSIKAICVFFYWGAKVTQAALLEQFVCCEM